MIKSEVVEKISKYFKLTEFEAEKIYDEIFSIIKQGVIDDNIVDLTNFGEFIIKYSNGQMEQGTQGYRKTVEFLSSPAFEEELNRPLMDSAAAAPTPVQSLETGPASTEKEHTQANSPSIEEEMKKKREALLSKISIHPLQDAAKEKKSLEEKPVSVEPIITPPPEPISEIKGESSGTTEEPHEQEEVKAAEEPHKEETQTEPVKEEQPAEQEDLAKKSFSDYFVPAGGTHTEEEHVPSQEKPEVIPQEAVDLHNQIVNPEPSPAPPPPPPAPVEHAEETAGAAAQGVMAGKQKEEDKSYYIWYKDSESSPAETQNLSYEYELLYQASKEAEYKSKLKIYVTSFILFFSIVLILLIFSPLLYKAFFTPIDYQSYNNYQQPAPESSNEQPQFKAAPNVIEQTSRNEQQNKQAGDTTQKPVAETNANQQNQQTQQQQQTTQPEQNKQPEQTKPPEQQTQQVQQNTEPKIEGVTQNAVGWADDKYKVIYIKLPNGKYTIQESAFDSEQKASKRISTVESYKISGLKGDVEKADLGAKGTWYRVRFGEFQTLQEARSKAEELRNKVK